MQVFADGNDNTVVGIAVKSQPTQTEYALGEEFNYEGLVVTFTYSDNTEIDIEPKYSYADPETEEYYLNQELKFSDFDYTTTGKKTITVTYKDFSDEFDVTVVDKGDCGYQYLDEDGTLTFYYGQYRKGAIYLGPRGSLLSQKDVQSVKKAVFDESFEDFRPTSCHNWFMDMSSLSEIVGMKDYLNTTLVTDMSSMFSQCELLTSIDLSGFNTQNVTNLNSMFSNCFSLASIDLSGFNTQSVTEMGAMFWGCKSLNSIDLSSFNTANVTTMQCMFAYCSELKSLDLSGFDTKNVTVMRMMFYKDNNLETIFIGPKWITANDALIMFDDCTSIVGGKGTAFDENHTDGTYARIDRGEDSPGYFTEKTPVSISVTTLPTQTEYALGENFDSEGLVVTFKYSDNTETSVDVTEYNLKGLSYSDFDYTTTGKKTITVTYNDLAVGIDVTVVDKGDCGYQYLDEDGTLTFYYGEYSKGAIYLGPRGSLLSQKDVQSVKKAVFDESFKNFRPTSCKYWFSGMTSLSEIVDMEKYLNTSKVTDMTSMFSNLPLKSLDLSGFDTRNVTDMNFMFTDWSGNSPLETIYVGVKWNIDAVSSPLYMFYGCKNLVGGNGTICDGAYSSDYLQYAQIDRGEDSPGYFTEKTLVSFSVTTIPTQTEYALGENFYPEGLVVTFKYSDNTETSVDVTEYDLKGLSYSDFDYTTTGKKTITVTYKGLSDEFDVTVVDKGVCGYWYLDEDGTLTFYYGQYRKGAGFIGAHRITQPFSPSLVQKAVFDKSFKDFSPTSCSGWFSSMTSLSEIVGMKEYLNTTMVTDMRSMFSDCKSLKSIDLSSFNTTMVTSMILMFSNCSSLKNLDLHSLNTSKVEYMSEMFYHCTSLETLDLSGFDTKNVKWMDWMFCDCSNLTTIYAGDNWTTDKVEESYNMFSGCDVLVGGKGTTYDDNYDDATYARIDDPENGKPGYFTYKASTQEDKREPYALLTDNGETVTFYYDEDKSKHEDALGFDFDWSPGWKDVKVAIFDESFKDYKPTSCERWFYNCQQLTEIRNLDYLNTENVTNMNDMFFGCQMLTELDLSNFNTTHVTNMNYMFFNCTNLATVYVGDDWITDNVTSYDGIFYGCDNLYGGKGTSCTESDIKYARIDGGESSPGYFTRKGDTKPEVVSIKVSKLPQQTEYSLGESFFYNIAKDTEGMIELSLSNGATRSIAFKSVLKSITGSISKLDSTKTGVQTLTVSFLGKETTFDVTVVDRGVCGYQFLDEDGTLTFYYGNYQNGAWYIGEVGFSKPFEAKVKKAVFDKSFANYYPTSLKNWFSRYENLTEIEGLEYLNTENVTNMGSMFEYCSSLTTLDVSNFNTANVRNMMTMFSGCSRLTTLDLSSFNTENLEDMTNMFTGCRSLTTLDLSSFNTENVTYMGNLFCDCSNIKNIYVGDNWITAPETEYCGSDNMFYNCTNLVGGKGTTYDANLYDLTYARIDDPDNDKPGYFTYKSSTQEDNREAYAVFDNGTLTFYYDENKPEGAYGMSDENYQTEWYKIASDITKVIFDKTFANYNPTSCMSWFEGCSNLTEIVGMNEYLNTEHVTTMSAMFSGCHSLEELDLSNFNTSNVTKMFLMFEGCLKLTSLNVSNFNTEKVNDMDGMFQYCLSLPTLDLSSFDTKNVTSMDGMFGNCVNLKTIYVTNPWNVELVSSPYQIFWGCEQLYGEKGTECRPGVEEVNYVHIDEGESNPGYFTQKGNAPYTPPAIDYTQVQPYAVLNNGELTFYYNNQRPEKSFSMPKFDISWGSLIGDYSFTKVVFDASFADYNLASLANWFSECESLKEVEGLEYLNTKEVTDLSGMFSGCNNITSLDLSFFDTKKVTNMDEMFWRCSNLKTIYVGDNWTMASVTSTFSHPGEDMFSDCNLLLGGKGTAYNGKYNNATYARVDDPENGKPGYFTYKGVEVKPVDTVFTAPTKLSYIEGNELDLTGGKITIVFSDETTEDIDLANADVTLSTFDNTAIGEQVITVKYKGVEVGTFTVTVAKPEPQPENPYTEPEVKDDAYQISTAEDLLYFMFDVNSGHVDANAILTQDIVINADLFKQITDLLKRTSKAAPDLIEWQPIGTEENAYRGTFDGNGHTISGIYIKDENQSNAGLFGNVASEAVIKNLGVTDSYIAGNENVGAICGKSEGTIVNCYTVSEVKGNKNVNPLVGAKETAAIVENCFYFAEAPVADDPCAKTAEQFKSGEVAVQLAKGATINGETFSGETFSGVTELPGTEVIEDLHDPENPPTPVSQVSSISNVKVWSYNRTIYIENAPDAEYRIIDLNGRVITTSKTQSTKEEIKINKSGVLIVIIGNQSFKITL